jgi:hypothetical protein
MDEIRVTEGWVPEIMVHTDDIVIWDLNESNLEKKFQKVVTLCRDFGSNVNLHKCVVMKIICKTGGMEKIECYNPEIKELGNFNYLGLTQ